MSQKLVLPTYLEMLHRLQLQYLTKPPGTDIFLCVEMDKLLQDAYYDNAKRVAYHERSSWWQRIKLGMEESLKLFAITKGLKPDDLKYVGFTLKCPDYYLIRVEFLQQAIAWEEAWEAKQ